MKKETLEAVSISQKFPLCVDLDGTLVKTDILFESVLALLKITPLCILLFPLWLLKGKAHFKRQIARRVTLDVARLPYNQDLLKYLAQEHRAGRRILLVTASDANIAQQIANHLGLFTSVIASDGMNNLAGDKKLQAIEAYIGPGRFAYAGNDRIDLAVWKGASSAILVNASDDVVRTAQKVANVSHIFRTPRTRLRAFIQAIRVHQWVKNALIFVPLIVSHQVGNQDHVLNATLAFFAFSLCASGTYLLNDLLDLEADRSHHKKKYRAFAAGDLPIKFGLVASPLFSMAGLALSLLLPAPFTLVLVIYFMLTLGYSFYLKHTVLIDVILLAGLYTIRIMGGGAAIDVTISKWLLLFSLFFFLSLAFLKRFSELQELRSEGKDNSVSRDYFASDLSQVASMGVASGYIAVLVYTLYISSVEVKGLYGFPEVLWLICPIILYWISRMWLLAHRGQMHHDPVVFTIRDKVSYALGGACAIIMWFATGW